MEFFWLIVNFSFCWGGGLWNARRIPVERHCHAYSEKRKGKASRTVTHMMWYSSVMCGSIERIQLCLSVQLCRGESVTSRVALEV